MAVGKVFNIQRFSTQDGPGIRTTVFLKGCNLRCRWCHNPESWRGEREIEYNPELCIGCGMCETACKTGAHSFTAEKGHMYDRSKCISCGLCTKECYAGALKCVGQEMSVETLMAELLTDADYYMQSGGGVTFSGGECMLQIDFLTEMCSLCQKKEIPMAIDTAGNVPHAYFERLLSFHPLFLYDIKAFSKANHKELTGVENGQIMENLRFLSEQKARIWVRVPYIPGANDQEMDEIGAFLADLPLERVDLLAYHRLGGSKRKLMGRETKYEYRIPEKQEMFALQKRFLALGINAHYS